MIRRWQKFIFKNTKNTSSGSSWCLKCQLEIEREKCKTSRQNSKRLVIMSQACRRFWRSFTKIALQWRFCATAVTAVATCHLTFICLIFANFGVSGKHFAAVEKYQRCYYLHNPLEVKHCGFSAI